MGLVAEAGNIAMLTDLPLSASGAIPTFAAGALIDASGEKIAFLGNVWHPTIKTGTISIRKVAFRTGAVTLNAASEVRVSLQDLSATAGPPGQPDGTQDQFYDFKTATATLAANTWQSTGNLSADRTVDLSVYATGAADSRRVGVVFEFQAFNASDSVNISAKPGDPTYLQHVATVLNTGSYALVANTFPIVAFECSDGSFAFLQQGATWSAVGTVSIGNAAAIRRAGVIFSVPSPRILDRISMSLQLPNGADGSLILYDSDGTTALCTVALDNDDVRVATSASFFEIPIQPVTLAANTQYRLAYVAGTATTATMSYFEVNSAALQDANIFGQNAYWTQHDGSSWTETTTRRPCFGLGFGSYHDGTGGGVAANPLRGFL